MYKQMWMCSAHIYTPERSPVYLLCDLCDLGTAHGISRFPPGKKNGRFFLLYYRHGTMQRKSKQKVNSRSPVEITRPLWEKVVVAKLSGKQAKKRDRERKRKCSSTLDVLNNVQISFIFPTVMCMCCCWCCCFYSTVSNGHHYCFHTNAYSHCRRGYSMTPSLKTHYNVILSDTYTFMICSTVAGPHEMQFLYVFSRQNSAKTIPRPFTVDGEHIARGGF